MSELEKKFEAVQGRTAKVIVFLITLVIFIGFVCPVEILKKVAKVLLSGVKGLRIWLQKNS